MHLGLPHPKPMTYTSPEIAAVSDDDSSVDSSSHVEMSKSEGEIWPHHPEVADDYTHDCDLGGLNVVEPDLDP